MKLKLPVRFDRKTPVPKTYKVTKFTVPSTPLTEEDRSQMEQEIRRCGVINIRLHPSYYSANVRGTGRQNHVFFKKRGIIIKALSVRSVEKFLLRFEKFMEQLNHRSLY